VAMNFTLAAPDAHGYTGPVREREAGTVATAVMVVPFLPKGVWIP